MRCDAGFDDDAGIVGEGRRQVDAAQVRVERAAGDDLALVEQDQMVGQPGHFVRGVADVDDGNGQFAVQALQIGQDFQLALEVEGGQRLVHQQDFRRGEQGAGDGDALAFAAGKLARRAVEQVGDAEQFGNFRQRKAFACGRRPFLAKFHIAAHAKGAGTGWLPERPYPAPAGGSG
jgi:hypothetical protein